MSVCFLDSRKNNIANRLQDIFSNASYITCVVAFWGRGALELFDGIAEEKRRTVRIVCNLTMGATNPRVIEALINKGFQVKHNPILHSKVYWTDKGIVLGSPNASANGLSFEGREQEGWLEAAIFVDGQSEIDVTHSYVDDIWCKSEKITDQVLAAAWVRWRRRRPFPPPDRNLTFIETLRQGCFSGRQHCIYIAVDEDSVTDPDHAAAQAKKLKNQYRELQGRVVEPWEGWDDIPRKQYIISYFRGPRGGVYFTRIWKTLPDNCDLPGPNELNYQFAYRVNEHEIGMTPGQRDQLTKIVRCIIHSHPEWLEERDYRICLERLLDPQIAECLE